MAAVTMAQLRTRVRAIMALYSGIGTDATGESVPIAAYPAFEVTPVSGEGNRVLSGGRYVVTRRMRILVHVQEVNPSDDAAVFTAFAAAEAHVDAICNHFLNYPMFKLDNTPTGKPLAEFTPWHDSGIGLLDYQQKVNAGFILDTEVTYGS